MNVVKKLTDLLNSWKHNKGDIDVNSFITNIPNFKKLEYIEKELETQTFDHFFRSILQDAYSNNIIIRNFILSLLQNLTIQDYESKQDAFDSRRTSYAKVSDDLNIIFLLRIVRYVREENRWVPFSNSHSVKWKFEYYAIAVNHCPDRTNQEFMMSEYNKLKSLSKSPERED
jgi:hypothetical protein